VEQNSSSATISFFVDAELKASLTTRRPITDCNTKTLEVGGPGILKFGEVAVVSRKITQTELGEIMSNGFTLNALADGKLPFSQKASDFDLGKLFE